MKRIKAFFYVALQSIKSPAYYREILKTPFEFSLKYYAVLVLIASFLTALGTYLIESPKMNSTLNGMIRDARAAFPEDLVFTIKDGQWEINKPEPLVIGFPGKASEGGEKLPQNIIVLDKNGTVDDVKKYDTALLINEKNVLVRSTGEPTVYPLKDIPNTTLDKNKFEELIGNFQRIAIFIPALAMIPVFFGVLVYYLLFRSIYLVIVGAILFGLGYAMKSGISFKDAIRIGLHAMTLPILIDVVTSIFNIGGNISLWFIGLNIFLGVVVLYKLNAVQQSS